MTATDIIGIIVFLFVAIIALEFALGFIEENPDDE